MTEQVQQKRMQVFRSRAYRLYFIGCLVSWIGNSMQSITNSWLVLDMTKNAYSVAILLIVATLPGILLSPIVGVFADWLDRKWLAAVMDVFSALVLFVVAFLWYNRLVQPWHLYVMAFLIALINVIYAPSVTGLIREIVSKEELLYANTTSSIALQLGGALGAAVGGTLIAFTSPVIVMVLNATSFLVSAICIINMRKGYKAPTKSNVEVGRLQRFFRDLKEGFTFIKTHNDVTFKYLMMFFILSTMYTINVLAPPFARNVLQVGVNGLGYMEASFAIGAIISNFFLPVITRKLGESRTMTLGMCLISVSIFLLAIAPGLVVGMIGYAALGATFQVGVLFGTRAQETIPAEFQGRVYSAYSIFSSLASLLVFLGMGLLAGLVSVRWLYSFQTVVLLFAGWLAFQYIYLADKKRRAIALEARPLQETVQE